MGILSYYRTLLKTHPNIIINDSIEIQHLYLDFNGFIYSSIHSLAEKNEEINEKNILKQSCDDLNNIVKTIDPKKSLYIAIDGVAPKAKMMQQRYRRYKSQLEDKPWDTNAITPGTEFMKKLAKKLKIYSKKFNIDIIIDDASIPGEGEHKILQYMKENPTDESKCIHGLDSDLIMLLLTLEQKNLYIYREQQDEINPHFVFIDAFRNEVNNTKDYIFLCFMAGNDFVPHLPSIQIKFNGIQKMIDLHENPIINDINEINKTNFIEILEKLTEREEVMVSQNSKQLENQLLIKDTIRMGSKGWKRRYYQECFGTSEQNDINQICLKYWEGLQWISQYYFNKCNDWSWFYPYRHAPCVSDLLEVVKYCGFTEFKEIEPYTPIQQLLTVLPPKSKNLLPETIQSLYTDIRFAHLFPETFELDKIHKTKEWQCYPILPSIEEEIFKVIKGKPLSFGKLFIIKHK